MLVKTGGGKMLNEICPEKSLSLHPLEKDGWSYDYREDRTFSQRSITSGPSTNTSPCLRA